MQSLPEKLQSAAMGAVLKQESKDPKERDTTVISLRVKDTFLEEIDEAAREVGLSRNKAVERLLRFALDANAKKKPKR